ncbi:RNA-binding protein [Shouchella shacheensis]|uniref:YlmH family RNA-binding protein n=1 Tax=Shouchella shacheensis TaxID=1649580 RepID=UPI0007404C92|nr:YlmH/Sll1252 family protein [Shouchella shacheensis]
MSIYEHFRAEEKPFIDQVFAWREEAGTYHQERMTDFLDPRQQDILRSVIGHSEEVVLAFDGGSRGSERKRSSIRPAYLQYEVVDWPISVLKATFSSKFLTLDHRDVLGALMNSGMKREKFGDIIVKEDAFLFACAKEMESYLLATFTQVGKAKIELQSADEGEFAIPEETWAERSTTISSMRLDTVVAAVSGLSRTKASDAIGKGLVKVNWKQIEDPSFKLDEGDYLSVRGIGRSKLLAIEGRTKKDKYRVVLGKKQG